ncbi:phage integrase N-terminal SAM-like domain-containing protein [Candidatus Woesearchaeota archaeon]|nr:phage integrase N-terminal SAM-like domain-containing protein [Candidatus Woesearchaeota archaeon]
MDIPGAMKKEMLRRRLSHKTIRTYLFYVRKSLLFCSKDPKQFSKKDCREFLERYIERSGSTLNVALNSLRFMMEEVLRKSMSLNINHSKIPKTA